MALDKRLEGADGREAETHGRVVALLSDPASYGHHPTHVERRETHGAFIFLAGALAYKIKRNVRYSYMDFSSAEKRRRAILRELEINKPHAPELYLGVVPITRAAGGELRIGGPGEPVEWALRMARFDEADLLSEVAAKGPLAPSLCKHLALAIHAFHRSAARATGPDSARQMEEIMNEVATALEAHVAQLEPGSIDALRREAKAAIGSMRPVLAARAEAGFVRRCHGDLHLANIVLWNGKPVLFDAIEFDESMATIDTLYDLAFLLMDLDRLGQRGAANLILNRYLWLGQQMADLEGLALLPLFLALRASIRAMVSAQRGVQETGARAETQYASARAYLSAAHLHFRPVAARLVAVGGLSGTGKSTLAAGLAPSIGRAPGAIHLRSDLERKALFNAEETERLPSEAYGAETAAQVYGLIFEKARRALAAGHSVIADAVFARIEERTAIEDVARTLGVPFTGLWLEAPAEIQMARVDARRGDASDATREVVAKQLTFSSGPILWTKVAAGGAASETLAAALRHIPEHQRP